MKSKLIIASLLLAAACSTMSAQNRNKYYTEKASDNIFMGVGFGGMAVLNDGMNDPTFNMNISLGKYITPVWGVRGQVGGFWQAIDKQDTGYGDETKTFGEVNLDAMLNIINLFAGYNSNRAFDLYVFGGPTMNLGKAVDVTLTIDPSNKNQQTYSYDEDGIKARFGATVGLGMAYSFNKYWAMNLEGRFGVTPSIFGDLSDCRKAESTVRVNLGLAYTFGGKKFVPVSAKVDKSAINEAVNNCRAEVERLQNELANQKPVVKEVVKEVTNETLVANPLAVFFKIGSAKIDDYGKVNLHLIAEAMKANPNEKYKIAGYCDKTTGSSSYNQTLSEKRAQAVYDALVAEGVNKDQLELVGFGGIENMFGQDSLNRVVILK